MFSVLSLCWSFCEIIQNLPRGFSWNLVDRLLGSKPLNPSTPPSWLSHLALTISHASSFLTRLAFFFQHPQGMTTELQMHGYSEMFLFHWTALLKGQQILYVGMATHQRGHKMKLDSGKHFTPKWRWMMEDGKWNNLNILSEIGQVEKWSMCNILLYYSCMFDCHLHWHFWCVSKNTVWPVA